MEGRGTLSSGSKTFQHQEILAYSEPSPTCGPRCNLLLDLTPVRYHTLSSAVTSAGLETCIHSSFLILVHAHSFMQCPLMDRLLGDSHGARPGQGDDESSLVSPLVRALISS